MTEYSLLMLGTVQFGMDYGVANTHGKPDFETVKNILSGEACKDNIWNVNTEKEYHEQKQEAKA